MQLTTFQVLDIAIDCLLFGSLLFVLLDFIRVLPSMIRASWIEAQLQEASLAKGNEVVTDTTKITKPKKSKRKKSRRRRKNKAVQMELLPNEMIPTATSESSNTRLTYKKVQADFADKNYTLEKYSKGRTRYRVNLDNRQHHFKNLQEAMDWLSEQPEPLEIPKHHQLELLDTVVV